MSASILRILAGGVAVAALSTSLALAQTKPLAITNAEIFDATGAAPYRGTLVVKGGRIIAVGAKVKAPKGATVIDAAGKAVVRASSTSTPTGRPAARRP